MKLWRINLKPGSKPGIDAAEFCIEKGVVGVGWTVSGTPATPDDYWALGKQQHYPTQKRKWSDCVKPLLYSMGLGDLVWTRNRKGTYFLGRVFGPWEYRSEPEFKDADLINIRPCEWECVGAPDAVPGSVITSFIPRRTVQPVNEPSALLYSRYLFAKLRGESPDLAPDSAKAEILELLAPDDLEDVAALYLQVEQGCVMFPSTCKSDTMAVECVLAEVADGRRVGLQVKRGSEPINRDQFAEFDGTVYLFQARGHYEGQPNPRCICLQPEDMQAFLFSRRALMPARIQRWLEFVEECAQPPQ